MHLNTLHISAMKHPSLLHVQVMRRRVNAKSAKSPGKVRSGPQTKTEQVPSFFDFFSPPEIPELATNLQREELGELQAAIENDYELGWETRPCRVWY